MRCKACDSILEESEIIWYPEKNEHEELCRACRQQLFALENNYSDSDLLLDASEGIEYD